MNGDKKYDAGEGKRWVCVQHHTTSGNKFNGWPESCGPYCQVNSKLMPLIQLELAEDGKTVLKIR